MGAPKGHVPWNAGKGKGYVDRRGYRWIRVGGKSVREHRHVMAQHLGRTLLPTEVVHHRNGVTTDNRIENLELMDGGDHMRIHHKGEERPDMAKARIARAARDRETIARLRKLNAELLEAVKRLCGSLGVMIVDPDNDGDIQFGRAAIAKATGAQP